MLCVLYILLLRLKSYELINKNKYDVLRSKNNVFTLVFQISGIILRSEYLLKLSVRQHSYIILYATHKKIIVKYDVEIPRPRRQY